MKILPTHKISSEIVDIVARAKKELIIVSPYVNFSNWKVIESEIIKAKARGVEIVFCVRNEAENYKSWEQVSALGITPKLITNLHAKFYMNEATGLITSMNLLRSSNSNSIEIGNVIESETELNELKLFLKEYVLSSLTHEIPSDEDLFFSKEKISKILEYCISSSFNSTSKVFFSNGFFEIKIRNNSFSLSIDKVSNTICINVIFSGLQADNFDSNKVKFFASNYFNYSLKLGGEKTYDVLYAVSKIRLSNAYLDNLRVSEKKELVSEIVNFIGGVLEYKKSF